MEHVAPAEFLAFSGKHVRRTESIVGTASLSDVVKPATVYTDTAGCTGVAANPAVTYGRVGAGGDLTPLPIVTETTE